MSFLNCGWKGNHEPWHQECVCVCVCSMMNILMCVNKLTDQPKNMVCVRASVCLSIDCECGALAWMKKQKRRKKEKTERKEGMNTNAKTHDNNRRMALLEWSRCCYSFIHSICPLKFQPLCIYIIMSTSNVYTVHTLVTQNTRFVHAAQHNSSYITWVRMEVECFDDLVCGGK